MASPSISCSTFQRQRSIDHTSFDPLPTLKRSQSGRQPLYRSKSRSHRDFTQETDGRSKRRYLRPQHSTPDLMRPHNNVPCFSARLRNLELDEDRTKKEVQQLRDRCKAYEAMVLSMESQKVDNKYKAVYILEKLRLQLGAIAADNASLKEDCRELESRIIDE